MKGWLEKKDFLWLFYRSLSEYHRGKGSISNNIVSSKPQYAGFSQQRRTILYEKESEKLATFSSVIFNFAREKRPIGIHVITKDRRPSECIGSLIVPEECKMALEITNGKCHVNTAGTRVSEDWLIAKYRDDPLETCYYRLRDGKLKEFLEQDRYFLKYVINFLDKSLRMNWDDFWDELDIEYWDELWTELGIEDKFGKKRCVAARMIQNALMYVESGAEIHFYFLPAALWSLPAGGITLAFGKELETWEIIGLRQIVDSLFVRPTIPEHIETQKRLSRELYATAFRSAIAAIMGRNMSHNIGSHAIWHLAERLQSSESYNCDEIGRFLCYLQKRMDFIAQVSTSSPSWCLTVKWLEFIEEFTAQACLLDNIVRTHQLDASKIDVFLKCEENIFRWRREGWQYQHGEYWKPMSDSNNDEKVKELKAQVEALSIDVPHGQIGAQALYSILENLLRNTAKFGNPRQLKQIKSGGGERLEFTITIEDQWDDGGRGWQEDFYRVKIQDSLTTERGVADDLNDFLAEPIIDLDTAELKPGHWGMKEIKICAAYLRMVRYEEIDLKYDEWKDGQGKEPPLIEVKLVDNGLETANSHGSLAYALYLLRPKEAVFVGEFSKGCKRR